MVFGVVVDIAVGLVCIVLGFLIWKREKINFLHDYHYKNVKEEDIPALSADAYKDACRPGNPRDVDEAAIADLFRSLL